MNGELEPEKKPASSFCWQLPAGGAVWAKCLILSRRQLPQAGVTLAGPPRTAAWTHSPHGPREGGTCCCTVPAAALGISSQALAGGHARGPGTTSQSLKCHCRDFSFIKTCSKSDEGSGCLSVDLNECWFRLTR